MSVVGRIEFNLRVGSYRMIADIDEREGHYHQVYVTQEEHL